MLGFLFGGGALIAQGLPTPEEMWTIIQKQQAQIEALQLALNQTQTDVVTTREKVTAAEVAVHEVREEVALTADALDAGAGRGFSAASWANKTQLGGYGELHLSLPDGGENTLDYHRFVLFVNHDFSDSIRLVSELELEHSIAADGEVGEVELEQAYLEFDLSDRSTVTAGLFLIPVGILNETHEPTAFFGVERNLVEKRIIPSTWWEGGVKYTYTDESGLAFDLALTSGLDHADGVIRSGRNKVGEAIAEQVMATARVQYSGIPGVKLGATVLYQSDLDQSTYNEQTEATLVEMHADIRKGPFGLRALYAEWFMNGTSLASNPTAESQFGYYVEPSYRFETEVGEFGLFARFSHFEYQKSATSFLEDDVWTFGVNYWPIAQVVLKLDYQKTDKSSELAGDYWLNAGIGYHF